ncbi:MAG: response regulator, partial [Brevundimonas sp.]
TTIIHRSVPYDLGGTAKVDYAPTGVHAVFCIPARHLSEPRTITGAPSIKYPRAAIGHPQPTPDTLLKGQDILLVEDSLIIALDAEDIATRLGAATVTTAATVEGALDNIDAARPTVAMLDINLGDRNSYPIADRLAELNIPFIFATGYGEQANPPIEHRGRLIVQKPYTLENVARAMDSLLGPAEEA